VTLRLDQWTSNQSAYQTPTSSTFLSEQTSQNKPTTNIQPAVLFLSEQISTSHQPNPQAIRKELAVDGYVVPAKLCLEELSPKGEAQHASESEWCFTSKREELLYEPCFGLAQ
jgi:hypothetical protein